MNLWLRFLKTIFACFFAPKIAMLGTSQLKFRVWPWDCDLNCHLTNSRYWSMLDLSRLYFMQQIGLLRSMFFTHRCFPVVNAAEISYFRAIPPFAKLTVATRLIHWDEKYVYLEHQFQIKGQLYAIAMVRGLLLHKGRDKVPTKQLLAWAHYTGEKPVITPIAAQWLKLLEAKKPV